ncbi:hypothetical protein [Gracilibacillus saliphilus]|uniref:hypothetical protein n=1 Tax=Gracilibacillus saliphilus TaxID=543890 RepID=UPI0013D51F6A|nr:hypothetical protein [Gracilibacillus saliphilus]
MDKEKSKFIATNTDNYLYVQGQSLEKSLDKIRIDSEEENEIVKYKTIGTIRYKALGLMGSIGDMISTIINWNEEVDTEITEAKKRILLEKYINKADEHEILVE